MNELRRPFLQGPIVSLVAYNYFFYAIVSIFISYLPVYFTSQGISPVQIGILLGVGPFISIISPPIWGYLSDKYKTVKNILILTLVATILFGTFMFRSVSFEWMFFYVLVFNFFMSPIGPLTDSLTYRVSEVYRIPFGSIRLFGSVGFAITAIFMGFVFERIGLGYISWVFLAFGLIALYTCTRLSDAPSSLKPVSLRSIFSVFQEKRILWFLFVIFTLSIPHRINDGFVGVYIESLGGTTGLVGTAWFFATGSEALLFGLSVRWLRQGRELQLIAWAAVFYCVRWILCALLADPVLVTYLQLFHGLSFAIYYLASLQYLYRLIPPELKSTGQTVFAAVFFGFAGIVGSLIAGWIFEAYNGQFLYITMTAFSLMGLVLVFITMFRERTMSRQ
ncbi:MFS transporter [Ammoniphilus sp. CFH 90114]|uniref:MFS transporter n=1 Tax=Ammoniphilus sp. CFH 90114 TaxID=2493665 RepID=UPI0013E8F7F2|nr:MFS transporter [Ammoniphilus sp. CFH 90114]